MNANREMLLHVHKCKEHWNIVLTLEKLVFCKHFNIVNVKILQSK